MPAMTLTKCSECGSDISNQALTCPKCGYPVSRKRQMRIVYSTLAIALGVLAIVYAALFYYLRPVIGV